MRTTAISVLVLVSLFALLSEAWLAEDAAITLRAVENLYLTQGPVYNPGEKTEVFIHPLWFSTLVIFRGMGLDSSYVAVILGLLLSLAGLLLMIRTPARSENNEAPFRYLHLIIPFLLAAHPGFRQFGASGMELGLLSVLLGLFYLKLENHRPVEKPVLLGFLLGLMYLTRPELGLFAVWYGFFFLWELARERHLGKRQILWRAARAAISILVTAGSWHLFRYLYFGELFPNTYYAKAGLDSYWLQGAKYLFHAVFFGPTSWVILLMVAAYGYLVYFNSPTTESVNEKRRDWFRLVRDLGAPIIMTLYVIRLGGDFMAFRFLLPELIMLAWLARRLFTIPLPTRWNGALSKWDGRPSRTLAVFAAASVIALFIPIPAAKGYIANERFHFVSKFERKGPGLIEAENHPWGARGEELSRFQSCLNYRTFRIANSQAEARCMEGMGLGYVGLAAGPYVEIIDEQGISDPYVARLPILLRFRPGHEHSIGTLEVLAKDVLFCNTGDRKYDEIMSTRYGTVVRWDPDFLALVPDIDERLARLQEYKREGSPAIEMLEARYGITVEELQARKEMWSSEYVRQKRQCWTEDSQ